jgi:phytanoyl-CoA hydroxylase
MIDYLKIKESFYENGFAKVEKVLSKKKVNLIRSEINKIIIKKSKSLKPGEIHFAKKKVNTIHVLNKVSKFFKKLMNEKIFYNLAENIIGEKMQPQWVQLFAKPAKEGLETPAHQDNYYWCVKDSKTVTFWIALDKVNKTNGALYYYNKSHKLGRIAHQPSFAKGTSQTIKKSVLRKFKKKHKIITSASPGDLLVHHGDVVHGSSKNLSNQSRRGISIWFKAKKAKINRTHLSQYKLSLKKQIQNIYYKN